MAVRKIINMGHPTLRQVATPVALEFLATEECQRLLADMEETLHEYGGIGLAAPQIDESIRLVIIEIPGGPSRYGEIEAMPLTAFVNPTITILNEDTGGYWEGCLSVPGLRGFVERPQHIRVDYTTLAGEPASLELQGFLATVFQHEFDHLDGKLYVDRITDTENLMFEDEFLRYHQAPSDS